MFSLLRSRLTQNVDGKLLLNCFSVRLRLALHGIGASLLINALNLFGRSENTLSVERRRRSIDVDFVPNIRRHRIRFDLTFDRRDFHHFTRQLVLFQRSGFEIGSIYRGKSSNFSVRCLSLSLTLNIDRFLFDQINIVTERRFELTLNRSVVVGARQRSLKFDGSSKVLSVEKFVRLSHFVLIKPCGNEKIQSRQMLDSIL